MSKRQPNNRIAYCSSCSSFSDNAIQLSFSLSKAALVEVYSVTNSMFEAFSGSANSWSICLRRLSMLAILLSEFSTARVAFLIFFCFSLRSK